jgi:hypothetical protein
MMRPTSTMFRIQPDLTHRASPIETAPVRPNPTNTLHLAPRPYLICHPSLQMTVGFLSLKLVPHPAHANNR